MKKVFWKEQKTYERRRRRRRERDRERERVEKHAFRGEPACVLIGWLEMSVRREFPEKKVFYPREVEESRKLRAN